MFKVFGFLKKKEGIADEVKFLDRSRKRACFIEERVTSAEFCD